MLSYRHAYHAGNYADVVKHVVLTFLLRYMTGKDAPICYVDTHAGAGGYDLRSEYSRKTAESQLGIGRLWGAGDAPAPVSDYLDLIRRFNHGPRLARYPGSPWLAAAVLRARDRLMLCELHGSDYQALQRFSRTDRRVHCYAEDGYRFSIGLLPPAERRGLILIDPSYELKHEYGTAVTTLGRLCRRFETGTYALWYPILDEHRTAQLRRAVQRTDIRDVLNLAVIVADRKAHPGMYGCGMIIVNPPWTFRDEMEPVLSYLGARLGLDGNGDHRLEQWADE